MTAPIGPGDWVEALGPAGAYNADYDVTAGAIYCVDALQDGYGCAVCGTYGHPGVHLVGKRRSKAGFAGCRFRPIYRPSESLFLTRLLDVPAPEFEGV